MKNVSEIVDDKHSRANYLAVTFDMHLGARTTVRWKCDTESGHCSWGKFYGNEFIAFGPVIAARR